MAQLKPFRSVWYARSRWRVDGIRKEKLIPLKTKSKVVARERLVEVNKLEKDIQNGMNFTFSWMSEDSITKVKRFTLIDAYDKWLSTRESDGIRPSTIRRNKYSMTHFSNVVGKSLPLTSITTSTIDTYRNYCIQRKMKPNGININLRAVKTFLNWCHKRDLIEKCPYVDMVSKPKEMPLYVPDRIFNEILELDWLKDHYKNAFLFYRNTGLRLSEPYQGELHGNWLLIGGDETKQRMDKELSLSITNLQRLTDMKDYVDNKYKGTLNSWKGHLSKVFLRAVREIDGDKTKFHFHCLRHTFAVRRYLQTRDIYLVKQEMGHSSVTTTEVYAKFSLRRLEMDFPSLVNNSKSLEKRERGHDFGGHKPSVNPLSASIVGT
tara:strand:- start:216 stop:1349 length:1134 start_codon:yes stop_codon:yes gene_type:complete